MDVDDIILRASVNSPSRARGAPGQLARTVTIQPAPLLDSPFGPSGLDAGPLTAFGAPDLYYLDMAAGDLNSQLAVVAAADGGAGLIVDMRGYPADATNSFTIAEALIAGNFESANYGIPTWTGPEQSGTSPVQNRFTGFRTPYTGPLVLLLGPRSVSQAEDFALKLLEREPPPLVVGEQTAGTDGNVTNAQLPGNFTFQFTGLHVLSPDGGRFMGVGITPQVLLVPTAAELAAGDPELLTAIQLLDGG